MFQATEDQIAEWKKKHGNIFRIAVEDQHSCYLCTPNRNQLSYAATAGKTDPLKFNETILRECWLGGDEEIKTDDSLFLAASSQLTEIIKVKKATVEKL